MVVSVISFGAVASIFRVAGFITVIIFCMLAFDVRAVCFLSMLLDRMFLYSLSRRAARFVRILRPCQTGTAQGKGGQQKCQQQKAGRGAGSCTHDGCAG